VRARVSRRTQSSGVSGKTVTDLRRPFTVKVIGGIGRLRLEVRVTCNG
jgi:hypothetical protein